MLVLGPASTAPALGQSAASRIDQPTPATLPPDVSTAPGDTQRETGKTDPVSPPGALQSSTDVMESGKSVQGRDGADRINPLQHLPKDMR
ncbi:hypothetical protein JCM2811A_47930 [Methylorubrum rhodinum]